MQNSQDDFNVKHISLAFARRHRGKTGPTGEPPRSPFEACKLRFPSGRHIALLKCKAFPSVLLKLLPLGNEMTNPSRGVGCTHVCADTHRSTLRERREPRRENSGKLLVWIPSWLVSLCSLREFFSVEISERGKFVVNWAICVCRFRGGHVGGMWAILYDSET